MKQLLPQFTAWLRAGAAFCLALPLPAVELTLSVAEPAGVARHQEIVTSGVPFPQGRLTNVAALRLHDAQGRPLPLQAQALATWRDGSVKWALLDFPLTLPAGERALLTLAATPNAPAPPPPPNPVRLTDTPAGVEVDNGLLQFTVSRQEFHLLRNLRLQGRPLPAFALGTFVNEGGAELPPDAVEVEERGPLRAVIRVAGKLRPLAHSNAPVTLHYVWRLTLWAGAVRLQAQHTLLHLDPQNQLLPVRTYGVQWNVPPAPPAQPLAWLGSDQPAPHESRALRHELRQWAESHYEFVGGAQPARGMRAPGWVLSSNALFRVLTAVRDFAPQFPKTLQADGLQYRCELYAAGAPEPFDWDQGLAKTHDLLLDFAPPAGASALTRAWEQPLFAIAPPEWYCASGVFGDLAPFDFDVFPDYETLTQASGDKCIRSMTTGLRHWGDFYYGGPYKGKNSYVNLEYDMPHNFLVQFARTGQRKYLDAARRMARHQADIDTNHFTGWQWKHSPRHTETQAEFGHTFTRGLLEHYFFTGDRRSREAALTLGRFFARDIRNPRSLGNERQIGWALISLLPVYEATWDPLFFEAARDTVHRLLDGLDPRGKFNIRWDNRIAFFNGIAATGFIYYYRATGDERVADAALRVIHRTLGMYPEYLGRTLEALAWAYQRTGDPRYLDALKLSYETTLARAVAWNTLDLGAGTIFTVHALPFMERTGLVQRPPRSFKLSASQFATENGLHARHVPAGSGELYFKLSHSAPLELMLIRKGAWKAPAEARLYDPAGRLLAHTAFPATNAVWQREFLRVPQPAPGTWRLALDAPQMPNVRAGSFITWDVISAQPLPAVLLTPQFAGLEFLHPRLYTVPAAGATNIVITLAAEGEGFKKAVLSDPAGRPAGVLEAFVDLGDAGRYVYTLQAPIPPAHTRGLWSLQLQDVSVVNVQGLAPYFATQPAAFFNPERGD
ncbi:MAG: glycoside hydrolase family 127 protein [Verrucomicrobiae bacterium]|nr:glycoside hydrolase family 127 protein [Verrucomicrobiae bacterium]